jgi:cobalt-zinc-cadmium efflux system protein
MAGDAHAVHRAEARTERRGRLRLALALSAAVLVVEVVGGVASGSLALLADAAHMFGDVAALTLAYAAMTLAERGPTGRYTFGFYRAEILAAFVNAEILLVITVLLFTEAYQRLAAPPAVDTTIMTVVALVGLAANLAAIALLRGQHAHDLNLRAAYLEVLSDAIGSAGVVAGGIAISATGLYRIDPVISAAIGLLLLPRTLSLLRQSGHILLEGSPREVDLAGIRERLLEVPGVEALHDLHFWTLTSGMHSASLHIRAAEESPRGEVLKAVQKVLKEEAGIDHATVQVEWGLEVICSTTEHA